MYNNNLQQLATDWLTLNDLKSVVRKYKEVIKQIINATQFLPPEAKLRQRLWYISNNTKQHPTCKICETPLLKWHGSRVPIYCSMNCQRSDLVVKNKKLQTRKRNYVYKPRKPISSDIQNKISSEEWLREQYYNMNKSIQDIAKELNINHHIILRKCKRFNIGQEHLHIETIAELITASKHVRDIKQILDNKSTRSIKLHKTVQEQTKFLPKETSIRQRLWYIEHNTITPPSCKMCGNFVNWDNDTQNFRIYCSQICQGRDPIIKEARQQTNLQRLGVKYPSQNHEVKKKYHETMIQRHGVPFPNQKKIQTDTLIVLNDEEQFRKLFRPGRTHLDIANELSIGQPLVSKYAAKYNIEPVNKWSAFEEQVYLFICEILPPIKIQRSTRKVISPYELDIYVPEHQLAIECNGLFWHSEINPSNTNFKHRHAFKTNACLTQNIHLIHLFETEWVQKNDIVKSIIRIKLGQAIHKINARECQIRTLSSKQTTAFLNQNHIQGSVQCSVRYGLFFKDELVSVIGFRKPRYTINNEWELGRFCNKQNSIVRGGASKLLQHFIRELKPLNIISYSDRRWNRGNIYSKLNFTFKHTTTPNYYYFKDGYLNLYTRERFQKHKLSRLLENFNPDLTEWENMQNNGYNRIWDCGNDVWIWNQYT